MQLPQPPSRGTQPTAPIVYDWTRFGRHRLRAPAGVVIDSPLGFAGAGWLSTLWPGGNEGGWSRMLWTPDDGAGGWAVPARLAGGDVIEFGNDLADRAVRWYGIVDSYDAVEWLTVQGPYTDPGAADDHAQQLLATIRFQTPLRTRTRRLPCSRRTSRG
jgi:hypothetical protein